MSGTIAAGIMPHLTFDSPLYDPYRRAMGAVPAPGVVRPFQESWTAPANFTGSPRPSEIWVS